MKILWLDTETTGLDKWKHDVIQIAGLVEKDGVIINEFEFKCQPHSWADIQESAIKTHGYSEEILATFPKPAKVWNQFCRILDEHINKYDKTDKFIMAGYNVGFDFDMMYAWWKKCDQEFFGSYFEYKTKFDILPLIMLFDQKYNWCLSNHKLETACTFLNIKFNAHDALADIKATRDLYTYLLANLPEEMRLPR